LEVHVLAGQNGEAGKTIEILGTGLSQKTDVEGRVVFEVGAGTHTVRAYDINQGGPCCAYVDQNAAVVAGDTTPADLKESNSEPRDPDLGHTPVRLWFTPTVGQVDLKQARKIIGGAKQAILFLMFNPGPKDTLLNEIIDTARAGTAGKRLYIHGAINQDPSTTANPVELFESDNSQKADFEVVLPAAIDKSTAWFRREMKKLPGTFAKAPIAAVPIPCCE
jgi:hypothetical protein